MLTVGKRILIEPLDTDSPNNNQIIGSNEISSYKVISAGTQVDDRIKKGTIVILNKKNSLTFKLDGKIHYLTNEDSILMFYNESEQ